MPSTELKEIHQDIECLKRDLAVIMHILSQEGELSKGAIRDLEQARRSNRNEYISHEELKKRLLK